HRGRRPNPEAVAGEIPRRSLHEPHRTDGRLQITDLWYDWSAGRNVNLIHKQLGVLLHDVEWNNGTTYYYTVGPNSTNGGDCSVMEFGVGLPRPNFLDDATYLGMEYTDGFLCNLWNKQDLIWYWEDVHTQIPVRWDFYDGISSHVMEFEEGVELEKSQWQAPSYCFKGQ
ncbi:Immunoglobulin-like fold-containing protein, partial [Dioscorea alata]